MATNRSNTQKQLQELAEDIVDRIKYSIDRSKKINTGKLVNSVKYKLYKGGVKFTMIGYGKYVIGTDDNWKFYPYGRRPGKKAPPSSTIERWLRTPHGQKAFNKMKRGNRKLTIKQAAFVIARSIGRRGIPAMKWQDTIEEIFTNIEKNKNFKKLEGAYVKDLEKELKESNDFLR